MKVTLCLKINDKKKSFYCSVQIVKKNTPSIYGLKPWRQNTWRQMAPYAQESPQN